MPAKSKAQFRFMQAAAHGGLKNPPKGLSQKEAADFVKETKDYKELPEKAPKEKFQKLKKAMRK